MRFTILVLAQAITFCYYAQPNNIIHWSEAYRLTYDDFLAPIPSGAQKQIQATTDALVELDYKQEGDAVNVTIQSSFKKNESWMRTEAKNQYTLDHEQGHFDISEIYARKMRKSLQKTKLSRTKGANQIQKVFNKLLKNYLKAQKEYDDATSHSIKVKAQQKYTKKIAAELKELEAYKDPKIIMKFK